jgi:energy-converting hydrogenase Eha subunit A
VSWLLKRRIPVDHNAEPERFGLDESVAQCLEIVREVSAEQRARARHLDSKTGTLAGFAATALTINATLGRPLLEADLPRGASTVVTASFIVAVVALGMAAGVAVLGGLRPMGHEDLTEAQIDAYSDRPKVVTPAPDLRMTWLRTMTEMTQSDRVAADAKARFAQVATVLLGIGLLGVLGEAVTLGLTK